MIEDFRSGRNKATSQAKSRLRSTGSTANAMQAVDDSARDGKAPKPKERPILYLSRTLRSYERNYTILELELGAVVWSILKLQRYLDGVPFTVVTDHQPILRIVASNSRTLTSPRVERWRMLLQPYMGQMTFVHKAGKKHLNVDALSRLERQPEKDPGTQGATARKGLRRRFGGPGSWNEAEELKGKG
jgi:hypothetical protein